MTLDWREAAKRAGSRTGPRGAAEGAVAGLGVAVAIGAMEWLSLASHYPLAVIPFATSIALVIGSPEAEPAQPRALVGGPFRGDLGGARGGLDRAGRLGRGPGGRARDPRDVSDRHVSSAGRDRSAAGGFQQPSLVISVDARAGRRAAPDGVCLAPASLAAPAAVAAALAVTAVWRA
jgi:hypothetical protein